MLFSSAEVHLLASFVSSQERQRSDVTDVTGAEGSRMNYLTRDRGWRSPFSPATKGKEEGASFDSVKKPIQVQLVVVSLTEKSFLVV